MVIKKPSHKRAPGTTSNILNTMEITFFQPLPVEYPKIVDVWEASVRATHHFLEERHILYFKPLILRDYLKLVNLTCARNPSGKIIGFIGIAENKVEMLFIHPEYFGRGVGRKLMEMTMLEYPQINEVDVNEQNEQALGFYRHLGFKVFNRSELDPLGNPFPILHMRRNP